jgi:hypothetical protein
MHQITASDEDNATIALAGDLVPAKTELLVSIVKNREVGPDCA